MRTQDERFSRRMVMIRTMRRFLLTLALLILGVQASRGQAPATPLASQIMPGWYPQGHGLSECLEDRNGNLLVGDPLIDGPNSDRLGWFATVEIDLLASHVHSELTAPVSVGPISAQVSLPTARLDWTAAPRFEVGYRLGGGCG